MSKITAIARSPSGNTISMGCIACPASFARLSIPVIRSLCSIFGPSLYPGYTAVGANAPSACIQHAQREVVAAVPQEPCRAGCRPSVRGRTEPIVEPDDHHLEMGARSSLSAIALAGPPLANQRALGAARVVD